MADAAPTEESVDAADDVVSEADTVDGAVQTPDAGVEDAEAEADVGTTEETASDVLADASPSASSLPAANPSLTLRHNNQQREQMPCSVSRVYGENPHIPSMRSADGALVTIFVVASVSSSHTYLLMASFLTRFLRVSERTLSFRKLSFALLVTASPVSPASRRLASTLAIATHTNP